MFKGKLSTVPCWCLTTSTRHNLFEMGANGLVDVFAQTLVRTNPDKTKRRNTRNSLISNYFNNVSSTRGNSERFQRRNPVTHRKKGRARQPNNAERAGLNKWLITLIIRVRERAAAPRSGQRKYWASGVGAAFSCPVHRWRISCKCRDYKPHRLIRVKLGASVD